MDTLTKNRIAEYDILRGMAISLMLMANSAAYVYTATPPLVMRLLGSFAAPSFMMLAGMMLAIAKKPRPTRGFQIIATGCLVDVAVWRIMPFVSFDVLYTIGIAILITAYPARFFSIRTLWMLGGVFILMGQGGQSLFSYHHEILDIPLPPYDSLPSVSNILLHVVRQLFIDGWFPIFPWLGFVWLGAALQRSLYSQTKNTKTILGISTLFFIVSSIYWSFNFVAFESRDKYSELFYPPDIGFCFTYASAFCIIFLLLRLIVNQQMICSMLTPFKWMGQFSLSIYVIHLIIIQYILAKYVVTSELNIFLFIVFMLWVIILIIAKILPTFISFVKKFLKPN